MALAVRIAVIAAVGLGWWGPVLAEEGADAARSLANDRARVETAMSLVTLGEAEQDGQMLAVAATLLAGVGPVAVPKGTGADGGTEFVDLDQLISAAAERGADTTRAIAAKGRGQRAERNYCALGYWSQTCDYNGYCRWEYIC